MTLVCRPTPFVRFMHRSEQSSKQLLYRMAHKTLARYCFYRRERFTDERPNSIQLFVYKRTTSLFFLCKTKAEVLFTFCLRAARLSSPGVNTGAFRRDLVSQCWVNVPSDNLVEAIITWETRGSKEQNK